MLLRSIVKISAARNTMAYSFARHFSTTPNRIANPIELSAWSVFKARFLSETDCRDRNITPATLLNRATTCLIAESYLNDRRAKKALKRMLNPG